MLGGVPFASQALGSWASPDVLPPTQPHARQAAAIPASSGTVAPLTHPGNSSAPPQQLASVSGPTVTTSEEHPDTVSLRPKGRCTLGRRRGQRPIVGL